MGADPQDHRQIKVHIEIVHSLPTMDNQEMSSDFPPEVRIFLAELGEAVKEYLERQRRERVIDGTGGSEGDRDESSGILPGER